MSQRRFRAYIFAGLVTLALGLLAGPLPLAAQNLFAPVVQVNDKVVTRFELDQRVLFYELLNAPGDLEEVAIERLIDERLQTEAAERLGVEVTPEQLEAGLAEFASRGDMNTEQFIAALAERGIARESYEDFVRAGLLWREVIGSRFGPRAEITEAEVDRAMAQASSGGGVRVLLSEIVLPATTPELTAQSRVRADELSRLTSIEAFAGAARQYSASSSRDRGGRLDWAPLGNLPPQIANQVLTLAPGQVTEPITVPNAIVLFQLRAIQETSAPTPDTLAVEFARYFIPGGRTERTLAEAARIEAEIDTCDDLYGVLPNVGEDRLRRDTLPMEQIAGDIALELAQLDAGEVSTNLTTADGQTLVFLMLCGRTMDIDGDVSREGVRERLRNQRLESYAAGYLSELRADAVIVYP